MLKNAALSWVKANCQDPKLQADVKRKLNEALQRRVDCWFAVGQALTRSREPYMIHCFDGELYISQITPAQADGLMLAPNALGFSSDPRPATPRQPALPRPMVISEFELGLAVLSEGERITGSFAYQIQGDIPPAYCLRLDCFLGLAGDEVSWSLPEEPLERGGTFRFSFDPLRESVWPLARIHRGPLAVFLKACSASSEEKFRTPISNTCGTIVDIG